MTMSGADRENHRMEMRSLNTQIGAAIKLLESLVKQSEKFNALDDRVSDIDTRLSLLEGFLT